MGKRRRRRRAGPSSPPRPAGAVESVAPAGAGRRAEGGGSGGGSHPHAAPARGPAATGGASCAVASGAAPADRASRCAALARIADEHLERGQPAAALPVLQRLCALAPNDPQALHRLGRCLQGLQRRDQARTLFLRAVAADPAHGPSLTSLFDLDEERHRLNDAERWLARLRGVAPAHPVTRLLDARLLLRRGRADEAIDRLSVTPDIPLPPPLYRNYQYLLGKALDKAGRCDEAYAACARANGSALAEFPALADARRAFLDFASGIHGQLCAETTARWPAALPSCPVRVVWQVGFPRSGTTLVDQVLDSHPAVTVLSETAASAKVLTLVDRLPGGYPAALRDLDDATAARLQQVYLGELAAEAGTLSPERVYVDKVPLNTLHLGLAARILPQARVVFCARHPADVVLSCYLQEFRLSRPLSCFLTLADTVALYDAVMRADAHYAATLVQPRFLLRYEDLVADFETQARRLLAFLGVPWDARVLEFHRHAARRAVATPSYDQVVQPLYASAVGRWQRYLPHIAPWLGALAPHAARFGYALAAAGNAAAADVPG